MKKRLKAGRELERLGYKWLEEPLLDVNLNGLEEASRKTRHSNLWH